MRKNKLNATKATKIIFTLIAIIMFINVNILIPLQSQPAKAQTERYGCCLVTKPDYGSHRCVGSIAESKCEGGMFFSGKACADVYPECKPVTCILADGSCQDNVPKDVCLNEYKNATLDLSDKCQQGCCQIGSHCDYETFAKCEAWAMNPAHKFDVGEIKFTPEIAIQRQCKASCATQDRGTCVLNNGNCVFTTRGVCQSGTFIEGDDMFPYKLPEYCDVKHNVSQGCGKMSGNENEICSFDSAGNQEECYRHCNDPAEVCAVCNNDTCQDTNGNTVKALQPYCKKSSCDIDVFSQNIAGIKFSIDEVAVPIKHIKQNNFPSGHAVCVNMIYANKPNIKFTGDNLDDAYSNYLATKSTGLQSYKLTCNHGDLIWAGLGLNRSQLCFDDPSNLSVFTFTNDYAKCDTCGADTGAGARWRDPIGDFFGVGLLGAWMGQLISNQCSANDCTNIKDEVYNISVCSYINKYGIWASSRIGRCVPKFAPGTADLCSSCGGGGDWLTNVCTAGEAYALGNCEFKPRGLLDKTLVGLASGLGITMSSLFTTIPVRCAIIALPLDPPWFLKYLGRYAKCTFIEEPTMTAKPLVSFVYDTIYGTIKGGWAMVSGILGMAGQIGGLFKSSGGSQGTSQTSSNNQGS